MRLDDRLSGLLVVALGIIVAIAAHDIPAVPGATFGPSLMPTLIGIGLAATGGTIAAGGFRARQAGPIFDLSDWQGQHRGILGAIWTIGGIVAGIFFVDTIGFPLFALALAVPLMLIMGARPVTSLVVSLIVVAAAFGIFYYLLLVPLPVGPLTFLG